MRLIGEPRGAKWSTSAGEDDHERWNLLTEALGGERLAILQKCELREPVGLFLRQRNCPSANPDAAFNLITLQMRKCIEGPHITGIVGSRFENGHGPVGTAEGDGGMGRIPGTGHV